ncbi:MAG: sigma-70 family RNA polymerase sigma factor [Ruminococcus sp.]|nr:sigma-70 family RNA polymerase sigma factor [Ruminococcus sp.]
MDDNDIIRLYWDRDERAVAETSAKYGRFCMNIAMNILADHEDSEECVNDTYLKAWQAIPPQKPAFFQAFLGRITRNLSLNRYNSRHTAKRGGSEIPLILDELCEIVSDKEGTEDRVLRKELVNTIDRFISALPDEKRYIFIRRYWYSDSISAIADRLKRTENSVSVELFRIRKKLRAYLTERGYDI